MKLVSTLRWLTGMPDAMGRNDVAGGPRSIRPGGYSVLMSAHGGERKTRGPRGLRVSESLEQNIQREADY